jgi:hypothetical protein
MKIGDNVMFKKRVRDYNTGLFKISGWQGRISKFYAAGFGINENFNDYIVEYDSITLKEMPKEYIRQYLKRKLDFRYTIVSEKYLEVVSPRDTEKEVIETWAELDLRCNFMNILEQKKKEDLARKTENKYKMIRVRLATEEEIIENRKFVKRANIHNFKIGSSVRFKLGFKEYHFDQFDMGGWEGRIVEIFDGTNPDGSECEIHVDLDFDSITLRQLPVKFMEMCMEKFIDFRGIDTWVYHLEAAKPRDTKEDVIAARLELDKKYDYSIRLELDENEPEVLLYKDDFENN